MKFLTRFLLALVFAASASATYQPTIIVGSSALPTGAALSANQVAGGPQTGSGAVTGTTQRVTLATDGPEVTNSTAIATNTSAISGKLITGGPQLGTGVVTATTQRVTLATDGPEVTNSTAIKASTASLDTKTPTVAQKTSALSSPVVLASDQSALSTINPLVLVPPTVNTLSATGTVQAQIVPSGVYTFCISSTSTLGATANTLASCTTTVGSPTVAYTGTAPSVGQLLAGTGITPGAYVVSTIGGTSFVMSLPATAAGTNTLNITAGSFAGNFQSSPDGSAWSNVNVIPLTFAINAAATNSFVAPGLFRYVATSTDKFLRFNLTAISSTGVAGNLSANPSLTFNIDAFDRNGGIVNLPYVSYVAATAATFPTGIPLIMPVDMTGMAYASIGIQTLSGTSQSIAWRQTGDPTGTTLLGLGHLTNQAAQNSVSNATTTAGEYIIAPSNRYLYAAVTVGTAVTANTITGCVAHVGVSQSATQSVVTTLPTASVNFGASTAATVANGAANKSLAVYGSGAVAFTAYSAQAWAAASGAGAVIADTNGGGAVYSFDISTTAWTVGTSTGMVVVVEDSADSGTTYRTVWMTEPITAVGHTYVPPIPLTGRARMRWFHISGSATTATVTVVAQSLSFSPAKQVQYFDRTASVGSGTAASGTNSAAYDIAGCKALCVILDSGTATAVASFQVQMSQDGLKWYNASAATAVAATTASMTPIPLTTGIVGRFIRVTCTATGTTQLMNAIHIYGTN